MSQQMTITSLGVGHGDATLLQWRDRSENWTCLIDGGESLDTLAALLGDMKVGEIDLLIASHFDSDHIGGLIGLTTKVPIREYWGPALPAYTRHEWLFGSKAATSLARAKSLETELAENGVSITYPLEGYCAAPLGPSSLQLRVLSPPSRFIKTLLTTDDISWLATSASTPLGWLLNSSDVPIEQPGDVDLIDGAMQQNALTPNDISERLRNLTPLKLIHEDIDAWSLETEIEPEFFGDSIFNNSSLVLWVEAHINGRIDRILLPGDQENWTYLLSKNPQGLQADILKAPHHGGRTYIESSIALNELFSFIRPRSVLFSASGRHKLPRSITRDAAIRWGATVFCTSDRGREMLTGVQDAHECCYEEMHCTGKGKHSVSIVLDSEGVRSEGRMACHSGLGLEQGPIIQIAQHIIQPSPVISRLAENELRKHIRWVARQLDEIHEERLATLGDATLTAKPVTSELLELRARENRRNVIVPHLEQVLDAGNSRGKYWAKKLSQYGQEWVAYRIPKRKEVDSFIDSLNELNLILFTDEIATTGYDRATLLSSLTLNGISTLAQVRMGIPGECFQALLWPHICKLLESPPWHCFSHNNEVTVLARFEDTAKWCDWLCEEFLSVKKRSTGDTRIAFKSDFSAQYPSLQLCSHGKHLALFSIDSTYRNFNSTFDRLFKIKAKQLPPEQLRRLLQQPTSSHGVRVKLAETYGYSRYEDSNYAYLDFDKELFSLSPESKAACSSFLQLGTRQLW